MILKIYQGIHYQNFGKAYSTKQEQEVIKLTKKLQEAERKQDGIRLVKVYTQAFPGDSETDTGIGKPNSEQAKAIYHMAKVYYGATAIKQMPFTQLTDKQVYNVYVDAYDKAEDVQTSEQTEE